MKEPLADEDRRTRDSDILRSWRRSIARPRDDAKTSRGGHRRLLDIVEDGNETARNRAIAYFNRGNGWSAKREPHRALEDFDQAIRLDPRNATAYYNRGLTLAAMRELAAAIADFDQA